MRHGRWIQFASFAVCSALVAWGGPVRGQEAEQMEKEEAEMAEMMEEEKPQEVTVMGQLVDVACFAMSGGQPGERHKMCAMKCAKNGLPVGVWDAEPGTVTIILAPAPAFEAYMQGEARVTGMMMEKASALLPSKIEVQTDGEWKEVEFKAM
jgi:hypothetical protein